MAASNFFSVLYLAAMAALMNGVALAGLLLTGEGHEGLVGTVEVPVLITGAILLLLAGAGAVRAPSAQWPMFVAFIGAALTTVLTFLTWTQEAPASAVIFELAGAVLGMILTAKIRSTADRVG